MTMWQRIGPWVRKEALLIIFALLALLLQALDPQPWAKLGGWARPETLLGLLGLMLAIQGIRDSGLVPWTAQRLLNELTSRRSVGMTLVLASGLAATVLTNDVSLFLLVPLSLSMAKLADLPLWPLISLEALAVNAGSALSPIGNPQNLLLWQQSGLNLARFSLQMLPSGSIMLLLVMLLAWFWLPTGAVPSDARSDDPEPVQRGTALLSITALLGMVVALALGQPGWGAAVILLGTLLLAPRRLLHIDWLLLLSFLMIFVALGHVGALPWVDSHLAQLNLKKPLTLYLSGIVGSQLISNVPAAVLLLSRHPDPVALAVAVNVGGFGLGIGSMANLIAWRLAGVDGGLGRFHRVAVPFLLVTAPIVYAVQWLLRQL